MLVLSILRNLLGEKGIRIRDWSIVRIYCNMLLVEDDRRDYYNKGERRLYGASIGGRGSECYISRGGSIYGGG